MKTIEFNRSRGTMLTSVLVLGGLTALYIYRRRGGKVMPLLTSAMSGMTSLGKFIQPQVEGAAKMAENKVSSSFPESQKKIRQPGSVDLDHMPAI